MLNLNQKETLLLNDQKSHEELCIKKYNNYANQTQSQELKQLFLDHAKHEQEHLNSINQILSGTVPNINQGQNAKNQNAPTYKPGSFNQNDADLCTDLLSTEKYVSGTYDTAIFEFTDHNVRQILNHIQKEEQQHGEDIYKYMESNGMYKPQ